MRLIPLLLILLACRADAGFPGCPECDAAQARVRKLGPDGAAAALLGDDAMYAEGRLVELGGPAVPALLKQFAGPKCAEPRGPEESLTEPERERLYSTTKCEQLTASALAAVLCERDHPLARRWVALVSKRLDARLVSWLALEGNCTAEVLDVLVPRVLAVVGAQRPRGPFLDSLVPLAHRALPALPWAVEAAGEGPASQVPALHLLAALGVSAREAWPTVAQLAKSQNLEVSETALRTALLIGEPGQFEPLVAEAIARDVAQGCHGRADNLLSAWPRPGGAQLAESAALVLRSCPGVKGDAARVLRDIPGAGRRYLADMLFVLRDERRHIFERAGLAQLLLWESWEPPLELSAADAASAQRLLTKAGMSLESRRFSNLQVLRYQPATSLNLEAVDTCRAEVGLAPLDAGWPIEGADLDKARAATACLGEHWCGPTRATFAQAIAACCAVFDASVPAWCTAR